jgi:hypothetical protein
MPKLRYALIALFVAYCSWALHAIFFGERIPVNGGLGWDGKIYYFISLDFFEYVRGRVLNSYYVHRIVPSLLVKGLHWLTGTEHSYELTGTFFGLMNLVSMVGGTLFLLGSLRDVPPRWKFLAATFALLSYGGFRQPFYYPILTDAFAFLLGSALLWAHLRQRTRMMWAIAALGAFTFPTLLWMAFPLIALAPESRLAANEASRPWSYYPLFFGSIMLVLALNGPAFSGNMVFGTFQPTMVMASVALPWLLVYVGYLWWGVDLLSRIRQSINDIRLTGLLGWAMVFFATIVTAWWAKSAEFGAKDFALNIVANGLVHPAASPVAHVVYLGPLWLLMLLHPSQMKATLVKLPLPLFWCTIFTLMLAVGSESRTLIAGLPFLIHLTVKALQHIELNTYRLAALLTVGLVLSKCWMTINVEPLLGHFLDRPMERYHMHFGPWMNERTYLINLATALICGGLLFMVFRKTEENTHE